MKKSTFLILIIMYVFLCPRVYPMTRSPVVKKQTVAKKASEIRTESGTIGKVSLRDPSISIEMQNKALLLIIIDKKNTIITRAGKNIKLSELRKGDCASVAYEVLQGKNIARLIKIKTGKNIFPCGKPNKKYR